LTKLELGNIIINDIQFSNEKSKVENGVLYVNQEEIKQIALEDENIASCEVFIARPGESVRITPVKDVIEPRVKVEGPGGIFPGWIAKVDTVGSGRTHVLKGAAVVTTGKIVGFQEGIIDMSGPGADYTPFSKTYNLVVKMEPVEGLKQHEHEYALRIAGFKIACFLGELGNLVESAKMYPELPRVAYVQMLQSQGLLHDTYVYGVDAKRTLTTMINPLETMDGAIVSGNCVSSCDKNPTYVHLNNRVIRELFKAHGKTLNFMGMIITNENVYLADKERSSNWSAKLAEYLGCDGVIISQEGFGNPDTDLIMNTKKIEAKGIKTVIITDEYAGRDGKSQSLADADASANAVVTGGNANQVIVLPPMETVYGHLHFVDTIAGGSANNIDAHGNITVEIQAITGATNETGFHNLSAR